MKIFSVKMNPIKSINSEKKIMPQMKNDTVSFTSSGQLKTEREKKAEEFGLKMFELFQAKELRPETIKQEGRKEVPLLEVDRMKNLAKILKTDTSFFNAYTLPSYGEDCKLKEIRMFIPDNIKNARQLSSIAHEYTHCIQRSENDDYLGLGKITNNDIQQSRILNNFAAYVFQGMEREKTIDAVNKFETYKTLGDSDEYAMCKAMNCKDIGELKRKFKSYFNKNYDRILEDITKQPEVFNQIGLKNNPLQLKRTIRNQCMIRANMEKEAYSVQKSLLMKINNGIVEKDVNFAPAFYKIMEEVLDF